MACRIGITTNPDQRKAAWQREHPTLRNWEILEICQRKSDAQNRENIYAERFGCAAHPGGEGPELALWYVYYFQY